MALCCIGGVCIPYTAIIPLLIYALQWILQKLADAGLLPDSICKQLQGFMINMNNSNKSKQVGEGSCCDPTENISDAANVRRGKQIKEVGTSSNNATTTTTLSSSCSENQKTDHETNVKMIDLQEDWDKLINTSEGLIIVCKFTATWCTPCKEIQPLFESLSKSYDRSTLARFAMVDVDVLEDVASTYKILSLPTFVVLQNGRVLDKYSGSNPEKLRNFILASISTKSSENNSTE